MPIFHLHLTPIQRSKGRSVIAEIAYATGIPQYSPRLGRGFRRRSGKDAVLRVGRIGTSTSRELVWQAAEAAERRWNSIEGRSVVVALPRELTTVDQWRILGNFAEHIHSTLHVPVEFALHAGRDPGRSSAHNPHGHLVFASREWDDNSQTFGKKTRVLDVRKSGSVVIKNLRLKWEQLVNHSLPDLCPRVSCLSHARAGRSRVPKRHLGPVAWRMERSGYRTDIGDYNRLIDDLNQTNFAIGAIAHQLAGRPAPDSQRSHGPSLERELKIWESLTGRRSTWPELNNAAQGGGRNSQSSMQTGGDEGLAQKPSTVGHGEFDSIRPKPIDDDLDRAERAITQDNRPSIDAP